MPLALGIEESVNSGAVTRIRVEILVGTKTVEENTANGQP